MNAFGAYAVVGGTAAAASFLLGFGIVKSLSTITDSAMWAIALMTFAPAFMAIGVSLFICLSHRAMPILPPPIPNDPYDSGAFQSSER